MHFSAPVHPKCVLWPYLVCFLVLRKGRRHMTCTFVCECVHFQAWTNLSFLPNSVCWRYGIVDRFSLIPLKFLQSDLTWKLHEPVRCHWRFSFLIRGSQILGARSPWRLNFFTVAPNISGFSVWNFIHVTRKAVRILRRLIDFFVHPVS